MKNRCTPRLLAQAEHGRRGKRYLDIKVIVPRRCMCNYLTHIDGLIKMSSNTAGTTRHLPRGGACVPCRYVFHTEHLGSLQNVFYRQRKIASIITSPQKYGFLTATVYRDAMGVNLCVANASATTDVTIVNSMTARRPRIRGSWSRISLVYKLGFTN